MKAANDMIMIEMAKSKSPTVEEVVSNMKARFLPGIHIQNKLSPIFSGLCIFIGPLGEKKCYDVTNVCISMLIGKRVFSKMAHRIFLKLLIKLGCLKDKKWWSWILRKKSRFWNNARKHSKNRGFLIYEKMYINI